jgi:hypothetical protein
VFRGCRRVFAPVARIQRLLLHPIGLFSVNCDGLAVYGFALGEAAVLHFGGFAGHRDGNGDALQTARISTGFPSQDYRGDRRNPGVTAAALERGMRQLRRQPGRRLNREIGEFSGYCPSVLDSELTPTSLPN